jgi:hypothetical protein
MSATLAEPAAQLVSGFASLYNQGSPVARQERLLTPVLDVPGGFRSATASEPGASFRPAMTVASAFSRRRFLALVSGVPALLFLTRCTSTSRREMNDETYSGPFFSDGSGFVE